LVDKEYNYGRKDIVLHAHNVSKSIDRMLYLKKTPIKFFINLRHEVLYWVDMILKKYAFDWYWGNILKGYRHCSIV
jgi:hypothetical protein